MTEEGSDMQQHPVFRQLFALALATADKLDSIWQEVGCQEDVKRDHLDGLVEEFERLCTAKITEEEELRDRFVNMVDQLREEMETIARRLGESAPAFEDEQMNLSDQVESLEIKAEEWRQRRDARLVQVRQLRDRALTVMKRIGSEERDSAVDADEEDLTNARVETLEKVCAELDAELEARKRMIGQLVADCQGLMKELKVEPKSALDIQIMGTLAHTSDITALTGLDSSPSCVGIDVDAVRRVSERANELMAEKRRRAQRLKALGDHIGELWERLRVPEVVRQTFSASVSGLGEDTLEAGERELARLMELKEKMLGNLIEDVRSQICAMWDEMEAGSEQRQDFAPMRVGPEGFCDDLLATHEAEAARLDRRLELMRPILKLIIKRKEILQERMEIMEFQEDSSRLTDRGRKAAQELMRLEKMGKHVNKDLPLLTDKLKKRLIEWQNNPEEGHGEPFLFHGVSYLATMDEEEEAFRRYKDSQRLKTKTKKREEIEQYKQQHVNSIHTPGANGNLVPRVAAGSKSVKKPAAGPQSATKKPSTANVPTLAKSSSSCSTSSYGNGNSFETPLKGDLSSSASSLQTSAAAAGNGNPNVPPPPPPAGSSKRCLGADLAEDQDNGLESSYGSDSFGALGASTGSLMSDI